MIDGHARGKTINRYNIYVPVLTYLLASVPGSHPKHVTEERLLKETTHKHRYNDD